MKKLLLVAAFAVGFAATSFADEPIKVKGCALKGVEAGCIVLRAVNGKTYNITAAVPAPTLGTFGEIEGNLWSGMDFCQQGAIIRPAKWTEKSKVCPKAKSQK
jgi:hypothetical protein